jgi:GNAT superfamily N-acetyltransferase
VPQEIQIVRLANQHQSLVNAFSCGHPDEDLFLKKDALIHQNLRLSQTYLLMQTQPERLISYVTFSVGSFRLDPKQTIQGIRIRDKPTHIYNGNLPCLFVGKLATDVREAGRGGGRHLIEFAIKRALELNEEVAIPFITLDAYAGTVAYYEKLGFSRAYVPLGKNRQTVTMHLALFEPKA